MKPINFPEANTIFQAPEGLENCGDLHGYQGKDTDGVPVIISKWELSPEEIEEVVRSGAIWFAVVAKTLPPISLSLENPFNS